jgi:hypothetical protein
MTMDPDLVRQQQEAEREALAFLRAKLVNPAPGKAAPLPMTAAAAALQPVIEASAIELHAAAPSLPAPSLEPPAAPRMLPKKEPEIKQQPGREHSFAEHFGRFISFGLAGAMLGGGLGIVAANYLQLPADLAQLAIFGPAGFFAAVCAFASFFAKTPKAYN